MSNPKISGKASSQSTNSVILNCHFDLSCFHEFKGEKRTKNTDKNEREQANLQYKSLSYESSTGLMSAALITSSLMKSWISHKTKGMERKINK